MLHFQYRFSARFPLLPFFRSSVVRSFIHLFFHSFTPHTHTHSCRQDMMCCAARCEQQTTFFAPRAAPSRAQKLKQHRQHAMERTILIRYIFSYILGESFIFRKREPSRFSFSFNASLKPKATKSLFLCRSHAEKVGKD
jgi:hypothetical protein